MAFGRTSGDVLRERTIQRRESLIRAGSSFSTAKGQNRARVSLLQSLINRGVDVDLNRQLLNILTTNKDDNFKRNQFVRTLQGQTLRNINIAEAKRSTVKQRRKAISELRKKRGFNKVQIKRKVGSTFTQDGAIFKVKQDGGIERVGFTKAESPRRERLKSGEATAKDLFKGRQKLSFESVATVRRVLGEANYNNAKLNIKSRQKYLRDLTIAQAKAFRQSLINRKQEVDVTGANGFTTAWLGDAYKLAKARKSYKIPQRIKPKGTFAPTGKPKKLSRVLLTIKQADPKIYRSLIAYRQLKNKTVSQLKALNGKVDKKLERALFTFKVFRQQKRAEQAKRKTFAGQYELATIAFIDGLTQNVYGVKKIPYLVNEIRKGNITLTQIGRAIANESAAFAVVARTSPVEAIARVGAEVYALKGVAKLFKIASKLSTNVLVRLNPKFVGALKTGDKLKIPLPKGKIGTLTVVSKIPLQSIPKQLRYSGQKVKLAITSQAQALVTPITKRLQTIAKPLGAKIPKSDKITSKLLERLDKGKITRAELGVLDRRLRTKYKVKGVLERSLFADPTGKIRPSRLGLTGDEGITFLDIIRGTFTFRSAKPQILIFTNITVEKFPKNLRSIVRKLKAGKALTRSETDRLLYFQTKASGKFKPLGFVTRESELTLPQGEIVKRIKTVGVTVINGKKVPIVLTEIYKPTKAIRKAINDFLDGKLTKAQIRKLNAQLKKKTGLDYKLSSVGTSKKVVPLKRLLSSGLITQSKYARALSSVRKSITSKTSKTSRTSKTSKTSRTSRTSKTSRTSRTSTGSTSKTSRTSRSGTSKGGSSRTSRGGSSRSGRSGSSRTGKGGTSKGGKIIKPPPSQDKKDRLRPNTPVNVYVRKANKYIKFNPKPVKYKDAQRLGRWVVNNHTSGSYLIKKTRGKTINLPKRLTASAKFFRRPKRKTKIPRTSEVEKRKYRINTSGERRGLKLAKLRKQAFSKKKRKTIKRK